MNVIVSNKYRNELKNLGIEISGVLEGVFSADQIMSAFSNYYYEKIILDASSLKSYDNVSNLIMDLKKMFTILDPTKTIILFDNIGAYNNDVLISNLVSMKVYNYAFELNEIIELFNNPRNYSQVMEYDSVSDTQNITSRIIGVKNVTEHAGATTLIYMMMQELSKKYSVKCLEINKDDFKYFQNDKMKSISSSNFMNEVMLEPNIEVILVDLNDYENDFLIKEIIYLIEPSVIKLNKLMDINPGVLETLKDKKVVINRTSIPLPKLQQFESESGLKAFDIIRNVNERDKINPQVINLLTKLGFNKANNGNIIYDDTEKKKSFF